MTKQIDHPESPQLKFAFAGLRHGHILSLITTLSARKDAVVLGAYDSTCPGGSTCARDRNSTCGGNGTQDLSVKLEGEKRGITHWYASMDELLADPEVDVVAVGDCFADRGSLAIQALKAGKHVVADKPLCTSLEELAIIREEAAKQHKTVGIMLDLIDHPNVVTAMQAVRSGLLGKVNNIIYEGQHPLMYESRPRWYFEEGKHGGVINDIAIHGIDYCRQMTGARLEKVIGARCWNFYAKEAPGFKDSAQLMLQLEGGIGVIADVSYASPDSQGYSHPSYWHTRIMGEKGYLTFGCNTDGVEVCLNGESGTRRLEDVPVTSTWLDRFYQAVADESLRPSYTEDMLLSQEESLLVQKAADENE